MEAGRDYRVDLSIYNGPLDLLLYLIRERELDIHDIPVAEITEQFLAHLEVVQRIDVERAGDFLLMAATLMLIKSRMLLPRQEAGDDEWDEELDPRTDLVRQLLEYKHFKDLTRELRDREAERTLRFETGMEAPGPDAPDAGRLLEDIGADDLLLAFERMMRETLADVGHQVHGEVLPMRELQGRLREHMASQGGTVAFRDFFLERRDRFYIVSVFLCMLEMLKRRLIEIETGDNIVGLKVRLRPEQPAPAAEGPPPAEAGVPEPAPAEPAAYRAETPPPPAAEPIGAAHEPEAAADDDVPPPGLDPLGAP